MWKVNAGRRSALASEFLALGVVAIGWREVGDYTRMRSRGEVLAAVARAYPGDTDRQNEVGANQIWRFLTEIKLGDRVITYDPIARLYHMGRLTGAPVYQPTAIEQLPVQRAVEWSGTVPRDKLSTSARGKLGAILTLFRVEPATAAELESLASGASPASPAIAPTDTGNLDEAADPFAGLEDQALERIKDRLLALDWDQMQEMVAALLRALGYRTIVSAPGADRGKDIVASRDGFGLEPPRIFVEVKHRAEAIGAPQVRAFAVGRHADDRYLYVSSGGFTREAYYEGERANAVTHLMTLDGLARALVDNYDRLDERGRALLPLVKLYWPV